MTLSEALENHQFILTEAAVIEALRHGTSLKLHPDLEHALLIYDEEGRDAMSRLYGDFVALAQEKNIPILITSPTWRANKKRLEETGVAKDVNGDAVKFMLDLRNRLSNHSSDVFIGGLIGCKNDCYQACEALTTKEAKRFHSWQVNRLARMGPDFLMAATLPSVGEAAGISSAMSKTTIPYIISFVINKNGSILDGTDLETAFKHIDNIAADHPPLGYMINCAYPSIFNNVMRSGFILKRLIGFQGNASSKDHRELDGSATPHMDSIEDWGNHMIALHREYGIPILGGCCGTRLPHLEYLANHIFHSAE